MVTLATTRFNTKTWEERQNWLARNNWEGCILGTPIRIKENIMSTIIILEMHNDENKIKAISLVKNRVHFDKTYRIYEDRNYNRYIYKGQCRLLLEENADTLTPLEKKIIAIFNQLLFKGACHFKRAQGITAVPNWIMHNKLIDFNKHFKALLRRHYPELTTL
jgi:hypothetical protein